MKISVIVPVYNVEKYLPRCLDSLINQTLKDIEIIVINDGSPDNSGDIIEEYKKKDKRIIYIVQENKGLGSTRNKGVSLAKGEYIYFVDSDDFLELDALEKMYNKAKEENSDIVICSYKNVYDDKQEDVFIDKKLIEDTLSNKNNKIFNFVTAWSKLYKTKFLKELDISFSPRVWYEDLSYATKVLVKAKNINYVNEPLYNYYIRETSIMRSNNILKSLDLIKAFDDIIDFYKNNYLYESFYEEIEFLAIDHFSSAMTRVIKTDCINKEKKEVLIEFDKYLRKHFYNLKGNKYLKQLSNNRLLIWNLLISKKYKLVSIIFKLRGNKWKQK